MSRTVVCFELRGEARQLALALQQHVVINMGINMDLNTICRNQFVKWMIEQLQTQAGEAANGQHTETAQVAGAIVPNVEASEMASNSNELEEAAQASNHPGGTTERDVQGNLDVRP